LISKILDEHSAPPSTGFYAKLLFLFSLCFPSAFRFLLYKGTIGLALEGLRHRKGGHGIDTALRVMRIMVNTYYYKRGANWVFSGTPCLPTVAGWG
jgi:hypothetical protein